MDRYLAETRLLDWRHPRLEALFTARGWDGLGEEECARALHAFVRDDILFGFNTRRLLTASRVLAEGRGQCNAKCVLLMALLRRAGIPCRFHGFTVDKRVQAGVLLEGFREKLPGNIQHGRVEALVAGHWLRLEGFIVDAALLASVQARFAHAYRDFCGYGIAVDDLRAPPCEWSGGDTRIQHWAVMGDLGVYTCPDDFHAKHSRNRPWARWLLWRLLYHGAANRNVARIRQGDFPADAERFVSHCPRGMFPSRGSG